MMGLFGPKTNSGSSSSPSSCAQRNGSRFVLTLMAARRPTVWQQESAILSTAAFGIAPLPEGGFALYVVKADKIPETIAEFDTRDLAVAILADIQNVVLGGSGVRQGGAPVQTAVLSGVAFALLVILSFFFFSLFPPPDQTAQEAGAAGQTAVSSSPAVSAGSSSSSSGGALGSDEMGVPQNADDLLGTDSE